MRRSSWLAWLVLLGLIFGVMPTAAVEGGVRTQEEAVSRALQLPFVPHNAVLVDAAASKDAAGRAVWDLGLSKPDPDGPQPLGFYSLRLRSSDGALLGFSVSEVKPRTAADEPIPTDGPEIDAHQAEEIAGSFVRGLGWGIDADWRRDPYPESAYGTRHGDQTKFRVRFVRLVNGIRFDSNYFTVYMNPDGSIVSYYVNWSTGDFADAKGIIPQSKASEIFRKTAQPVLYYLNTYHEKPLLVYNLWQRTMTAKDGKLPPETNHNPYPGSGSWKALVSKPLAPLITNAKLTDKQMREKAKKLLGITGSYKESKPFPGQYRFTVSTGNPKEPLVAEVRFNLNTGQVEWLFRSHRYDPAPSTKADIGEKKARQTAEAFIKAAMPAYADKLKETSVVKHKEGQSSKSNAIYILTYNRVAGGTAVEQETVTLDIFARDGTILGMESTLSQRKFPVKAAPKVSREQASQKLLSLYDVVLKYRWTTADRLELFYELVPKPSVPLFYTGLAPVLDADAGGWLNVDGEPAEVST